MTATPEEYVEYALTWVGITDYVYGGLSLTTGTDCSGFVELTAAHFGISSGGRTTQDEWANLPPGDGSVGDLVLFDVPSDGPPQPQHVGICIGGGQMVNAPHTGVRVRVEPIPHVPGSITVMGYRRMAFATSPAPPTEVPELLIAPTPTGKGYWTCSPQGAVDSYGDATYQGGLNPGAPLSAGGPPVPAGSLPAGHTVTGFTALPIPTLDGQQGYWMITDFGGVYAFGAAQFMGGPNA